MVRKANLASVRDEVSSHGRVHAMRSWARGGCLAEPDGMLSGEDDVAVGEIHGLRHGGAG